VTPRVQALLERHRMVVTAWAAQELQVDVRHSLWRLRR
jgi:hypothetical protein